MRFLLHIAAILIPTSGFTCSYFPEPLRDKELVSGATSIVLAQVVSFEPAVSRPASKRKMASFNFVVIETLKGETPTALSLNGFSDRERLDAPGDFTGHRSPAFWAMQSSNSVSPGDCDFYGIFRQQETYLIFIVPGGHPRAFENIRSGEDLWLNVVRLLISRVTK